jgi:hypothetical protein
MRVSWLADVLRDAGLEVVQHAGWKGRGRELDSVEGVVAHHTVTGPAVPDSVVADILIDGHSTLPGPLSQLGLDRAGRYHVIADGRCNHNGYGQWGNQSIGIEAFNDGQGERWPSVQIDAYQRGVAAILVHLGLPASKVLGHKETDPDRKIDPAGIDMAGFRTGVATIIDRGSPPPPSTGDLTVAEINDILERLNAIELRVTQLQQEVVGTLDSDGKSRMDRLAKTIDKTAADVEGLKG